MSSGAHGALRPYPAIVPIELALAVAAPVAAVLLVGLYWVPLAIFVMTSIPAGIALYINGFLPVPRLTVLLGVALYVAGGLLSTFATTGATFSEFVIWSRSAPSFCISSSFFLLFRCSKGLTRSLFSSDGAGLWRGNGNSMRWIFFSGDPRAIQPEQAGRFVGVIGAPGSKWPTALSATCAVFFSAAFALVVSSGSSRAVESSRRRRRSRSGCLILTLAAAAILAPLRGCCQWFRS